jgi:hypothetical protein
MSSAEVSYGEIKSQKLNDVLVKEQYQVKITNRFAALEKHG